MSKKIKLEENDTKIVLSSFYKSMFNEALEVQNKYLDNKDISDFCERVKRYAYDNIEFFINIEHKNFENEKVLFE